MNDQPQKATGDGMPPIPDEAQQEGARWRFHRPSSQAVADWFKTVPLDAGLEHKDYVGGIVLIPQRDKVWHTLPGGIRREREEQVYTPYVQIGTRIFYARRLAEERSVRYVPKPVDVPKITDPVSLYYNEHMPPGLWWHVVGDASGSAMRFLCCTWSVSLVDDQGKVLLEGLGTKQVSGVDRYGNPDENTLMKAETGAIGRALGIAGILTVGTGVATYEDMQDYAARDGAQGPAATAVPQLPPTEIPGAPHQAAAGASDQERLGNLQARYLAGRNRVDELGLTSEYDAWWMERKDAGWRSLSDVPLDALAGMVAKLEQIIAEAADQPLPEPTA